MMRTTTRRRALGLLLACFCFLAPSIGLAEESDFGPGLFSFVKPLETTPAQVLARNGKPHGDYATWLVEGEVDFLVGFPSTTHMKAVAEKAKSLGKKVRKVRVLEYRDPDAFSDAAHLVFFEDKLWYALVPVSPSEATPKKVEDRYGRKPVVSTRTRLENDIVHSMTLHAFPDLGMAWVQTRTEGFDRKAVFPPVTRKK